MSTDFENIVPILRVEDMELALEFYVGKLGFKNAEWAMPGFTSVTHGKHGIYLCKGEQGRGGAWIWIGVDDIKPLYEQYKALGVKIHMEPTNFPWAYEMQIEDPDGNVIRMGSEPLED